MNTADRIWLDALQINLERKIDPSRLNEDKDHDGRKGVDCSSLVYFSLEGAGFNLKMEAKDFGTRTLFNGKHITNYAQKKF